ncbi:hypothetical protein ACWGRV_25485 [Streptomyces sp. NPDC055663]
MLWSELVTARPGSTAVDRALAELVELREALEEAATAPAVQRLWEFCRTTTDAAVIRSVEAAPQYHPLRKVLAARWAERLSHDEARTSRQALAETGRTGLDGTSMLAIEGYRGIRGELELLRGRSVEQCAVLGCGPYPETLMALQASGLVRRRAVGVDRDEDTATLAAALVERFCVPEPEVRVVHEDADAVDFAPYDLVVVANGLLGKGRLMDRVHRTAPPGVRVLIRRPVLMGRLLYEHVEPRSRPGWAVAARHFGTPLSETLLLERSDHP